MKLLLLLIASISVISFSQTKNDFLFNNLKDFESNQELVLIIKEPQSELAKEIGSRFYSFDLAAEIKNNFVDSSTTKFFDLCGFDMYFYLKSGRNLRPIAQLNSSCSERFLTKNNIELLKQGSILYTDTLLVNQKKKSNYFAKSVYYVFRDEETGLYEELQNSVAFPLWYYDYWFEIEFKSNKSI